MPRKGPASPLRALAERELLDVLRRSSGLAAKASPELLRAAVSVVRERLESVEDFDREARFLFEGPGRPDHDELIPDGRSDTNTAAVLRLAREGVAGEDRPEAARLEAALLRAAREAGWRPEELWRTLGCAIGGRRETPRLVEAMCLLGRATCIERIDDAIDVLGDPENPILGQARR